MLLKKKQCVSLLNSVELIMPSKVAGFNFRVLYCIDFFNVTSTLAVVDLNGRYFGGRLVNASFYNYDKFQALKLSD